MSVIKLEVTEDHLKLVKVLQFSRENGHLTTQSEEGGKTCAFGHEELYDEITIALKGRPTEFDPLATELFQHTEEEKEYMDKLWGDMDKVLELKCYYDQLVPGIYKRKYHDREWKKID